LHIDIVRVRAMLVRGGQPTKLLDPAEAIRAPGGNYIKGPKVSVEVEVEVEAYRPFFILGEVKRPGGYPYVNAMTGRPPSIWPRAIPREPRSGWCVSTPPVQQREPHGRGARGYPVHPGDTIYVLERFF
jgi:polysaccharide export outer membrane protein